MRGDPAAGRAQPHVSPPSDDKLPGRSQSRAGPSAMIATFDTGRSSEADESAAADSEQSTRSWIAFGSGAAAAAIAGALMLHSNFGARFGAIDDHEALRWMGSNGHLGASRYFSTLFRDT